jgi:hypothetical protein
MGFFDWLSGKKEAAAPKPKAKKAKAPAAAPEAPAEADGLTPEVLAAISASIGIVLEEADDGLVAAIAAAIVHAGSGGQAVRFKKTGGAWAAYGRHKLMDSRQHG